MSRRGLTKDLILDAAGEVADERGLPVLSLAIVAERLKVKSPSLYNHFEGLEAMRRALSLRALNELAAVAAEAAIGKSRQDALLSMGHAIRQFARSRPGLYAATVRAQAPDDKEGMTAVRKVMASFQKVLEGYGIKDSEAIHTLRALRSLVHGFVLLESSGGFGLPVGLDESFSWMLERLVTSLGKGRD